MSDLITHYDRWVRLTMQLEELESERDEAAEPIQVAAHAIIGARSSYTRSGQYPRLVEADENGLVFSVSNGIDEGDDFTVRMTLLALQEDTEAVREREAQERRRAALTRLRAQHTSIGQQIARIEADG